MRQELLREIYDSVDAVNRIMLDEELTDYTKKILIKAEEEKQISLRAFLTEWEAADNDQ